MICFEEYSCNATTFYEETIINLVRWEMENRRIGGSCYRAAAARPRGRRRSIDEILTLIMSMRGTHLRPPLNEGEITELLAAGSHERRRNCLYWAISGNHHLGRTLSQQLYRECEQPNSVLRNTMAWITPRQRIYLILQALQFEERCRVRQLYKQLFDNICTLIALDVIIKHENLSRNSPEQTTFNRLMQQHIRQKRELRQAIEVLVNWRSGMAGKFEPAHADIINGFIDRLNTCYYQWQQKKTNAFSFAQPPTPEQVHDYFYLEALEQQLLRIQALRSRLTELSTDISILRSLRRGNRLGPRQINGASEDIRPMIREIAEDEDRVVDDDETRRIDHEIERLRAETNELRLQVQRADERSIRNVKTQLENRLNRGGLRQRIRNYFDTQNNQDNQERFRRTQINQRNELLRDFQALVSSHTSHRLTSLSGSGNSETRKWQVYLELLEGLINGITNVSLEHLITDIFVGYGPINSDRDVGIRVNNRPPDTLSIGTYPGHGGRHALCAVDMDTNRPWPFLAVAPDLFSLPGRLGGPEEFLYEARSAIVRSRTRVTNDLQDVFAKISYGLLRPAGRNTRSADIQRIMLERELTDAEAGARGQEEQRLAQNAGEIVSRERREGTSGTVMPPEVGANPEVARILAGLAYHNLTEVGTQEGLSERAAGVLSARRQHILNSLEEAVRGRLSGVSGGTRIFRESGIRVEEGGVGIRSLIVLRDPPDRFREVLNAVYDEISSRGDITRSLWNFLWDLYGAGAELNRAGQSVTVDHYYRSRRDNRLIAVRVFYTHVHAVSAEGNIRRCQQIGQVGTTGNAVSPHNHVEISLHETDQDSGQVRERDVVGFLLPHEFFPLFR
jgi:hypothetical protein